MASEADSDSKKLIATEENQSISLDRDENKLDLVPRLSRDIITPSPPMLVIKGENSQNSVGTISLDGEAGE